MGAVYLGRIASLGDKKVAIKEMVVPEAAGRSQEQAIGQFKKEATFLAHLDHPNLVKVTDFFAEGDRHYLVMDYVEGRTLQQILEERQRPFLWNDLKQIAASLTEVLSYLHSQSPPILFRDLKPANIMLDQAGRMKLIDFGIARTAAPGMETSTFLKGTGTNGFSPIEQYGVGDSTDQRSDIYAFGATLYYLLSGKLPPEAVARVSGTKELIPLRKLNSEIPPALSNILSKCMAVKQGDRYAHVGLVRQMLQQVKSEEEFSPFPSGDTLLLTPQVAPAQDNSSTWAAALATLGMAAAVMLMLFVYQVRESVAEPMVSQRRPNSQPTAIVKKQPKSYTISGVATDNPAMPKTRLIYRKGVQEVRPTWVDENQADIPTKTVVRTTTTWHSEKLRQAPTRSEPKTSRPSATLDLSPNYPKAKTRPSDEFQTDSRPTQPILPHRPRRRRPTPGTGTR